MPAQHPIEGGGKDYDYSLKFLLVGDSDVGKNEILSGLEEAPTSTPYSTRGMDHKTTMLLIDGKRVRLQLWNTSGQGRFSTILQSYSRGAQGILLIYDITNKWSFEGIDRWLAEVNEHAPGIPKVLVGNRLHLAYKRQVTELSAEQYSQKHDMAFFECSPLCDFNVVESFAELSRLVLKRNGMNQLGVVSREVPTLQELCIKGLSSRLTVYGIDHLPLPPTVKLPPLIKYFPEFITEAEEAYLLKKVYDAPKPKWTQLSNRRLQNWGGLPHARGMVQEAIPQWLQTYMDKISALPDTFYNVKPNHCLVNEYLPGQGIMPHEDGNLFYPTVSTITLGSHTVLDFYTHIARLNNSSEEIEGATDMASRKMGSLLLETRSLVLVQEDMYKSYLHGIQEQQTDTLDDLIANIDMTKYKLGDTLPRGTRVSLTIRHVPKTAKLTLFTGRK